MITERMGSGYMERTESFVLLDETNIPQMAELYKESFIGEPWNDDWSDNEQLMAYIRDLSCSFNSLNYGLIIDGELAAISIGSVHHWWEGTNYDLEEFCVSPKYQGQGVGSRFMKMIEDDIRDRGLAGIFLQTDNDKPSYRFYKKNGFNELVNHVSFFKDLRKTLDDD